MLARVFKGQKYLEEKYINTKSNTVAYFFWLPVTYVYHVAIIMPAMMIFKIENRIKS